MSLEFDVTDLGCLTQEKSLFFRAHNEKVVCQEGYASGCHPNALLTSRVFANWFEFICELRRAGQCQAATKDLLVQPCFGDTNKTQFMFWIHSRLFCTF